MAKMSRDKGKVGEREVAALLREYGFEAKRGIQFQGGNDSPDVKHNIPGVHIEVKRVERLNLNAALSQAIEDAMGSGNRPVIFHRSSRQPWLVTVSARDWLRREQYVHHSEKQIDLINASAGSTGRPTSVGKAGTTEGEGRSGANLTGLDTALAKAICD